MTRSDYGLAVDITAASYARLNIAWLVRLASTVHDA